MNQNKDNYGYMTDCTEVPYAFPPQHQNKQPGLEYLMKPRPISECGKKMPEA